MKFLSISILYLLILSSTSQALIYEEVFISGPHLNLQELWTQVSNRSPYKTTLEVPDPKKKKVTVHGLSKIQNLIALTKKYYIDEYQINLKIKKKDSNFIFYTLDKKLPESKSLVEKVSKEIRSSNKPKFSLTPPKLAKFDDLTPIEEIPVKPKNIPQKLPQPQADTNQTIQEENTLLPKTSNAPQITTGPKNSQQENDYRLKPGDTIEVSVWGEDMDRELTVRPDGKISYILIGEIDVVGKTFSELKKIIQTRLSQFIIEPNVSIIGKSFEGNFVSILGAVKSPGRKIVSKSDRVLDVIAKASGLRYEDFGGNGGEVANLKNAYLSRNGQLINVDFTKLIYEGDMSQNAPIEIGDFIYIPSSIGVPIYVTGEVNQPTSMPFRGKPTLIDAVTSSKGFNTKANKSKIYIVRGGMIKPTIITSNYRDVVIGKTHNPFLEPGDIIYVPPTTITKIERLSSQILPFLDAIVRGGDAKDSIQKW